MLPKQVIGFCLVAAPLSGLAILSERETARCVLALDFDLSHIVKIVCVSEGQHLNEIRIHTASHIIQTTNIITMANHYVYLPDRTALENAIMAEDFYHQQGINYGPQDFLTQFGHLIPNQPEATNWPIVVVDNYNNADNAGNDEDAEDEEDDSSDDSDSSDSSDDDDDREGYDADADTDGDELEEHEA